VYVANSDVRDRQGRQIVTAYALRRPDQRWSVLLVNKDARHAYSVKIAFGRGNSVAAAFPGLTEAFQYSRQQYVWKVSEAQGHPIKTEPPRHFRVMNSEVMLPPFSLTVVRGFARP
jgi:hypothetical protein